MFLSIICHDLTCPPQTLWRCYAAEKPGGCAATWKMYVLTPELFNTVDSDSSSPNIRKLNISVIIQSGLNEFWGYCVAHVLCFFFFKVAIDLPPSEEQDKSFLFKYKIYNVCLWCCGFELNKGCFLNYLSFFYFLHSLFIVSFCFDLSNKGETTPIKTSESSL